MPSSTSWCISIKMDVPSLSNNMADADRLAQAVRETLQVSHVRVAKNLFDILPEFLRAHNYHIRCLVFFKDDHWAVLAVFPPAGKIRVCGAAIDLGSTRMALSIVDLLTSEVLQTRHMDNPQIPFGADVLTRVHHAQTREGRAELQNCVLETLQSEMELACDAVNLSTRDIYLAAVAGNTVMTHLFMGLETRYLVREPYIPVVNRPGTQLAEEIGFLLHPNAQAFIFPNIGSYFGGDVISGILAIGMAYQEEVTMLIDVGTNAEVVLGNKEWLMACAGAAGPALENGVTQMGMRAMAGAIDSVHIDPTALEFTYTTIGNQAPMGICGSGIIDLAAQLFVNGLLDIRGKLVGAKCPNRIYEKNGMMILELVPARDSGTKAPIILTQADFDSLIRSKAAMYTILETITQAVGMTPQDIRYFYVAGTFGAYIRPDSAISIGMLPDLPRNVFEVVGNASLKGAIHLLGHRESMLEIAHIQQKITYMELNVNQDFMNRFSAAKFLPHTDPSRFPSVTWVS